MIAFAVMLLMAVLAAWIVSTATAPVPRAYLRFACALLAALAVAAAWNGPLAGSVALIVCATVPAMLAMAARLVAPAFALGLAAGFGLAAALTGIAALALAPLVISAALMTLARRSSTKMWASSFALVAGAACFAVGDLPALMAFLGVAVLGISLALRGSGRGEARPARSGRDRRYGAEPAAARSTSGR